MAEQVALGDGGKGLEFGLIELVVGKASGKIAEEASKPAKSVQTLVELGYVPATTFLT